jgi:hypothetical protein
MTPLPGLPDRKAQPVPQVQRRGAFYDNGMNKINLKTIKRFYNHTNMPLLSYSAQWRPFGLQ